MDEKIKILTLSDHPLSPSGVGTQTKYVMQALLESGKFKIISLGGAMKHVNYEPIKVGDYGDDWIIYPVDDYGTPELIRSIIRNEKIDMLWFMTDPRFYEWLWTFDNEIRAHIPMIYYHVWDNYPYPSFNTKWYAANDNIVAISKVTYDIVKNLVPDVRSNYIPHAVDDKIFAPMTDLDRKSFRNQAFEVDNDDTMVVFWNNRNARRKQSGSLIYWFKEFIDEIGHDKAKLIMHTDPGDPHGQDLYSILNELGLKDGQVTLSVQKLPPEMLARLYAAADLTVNISDAEGFGLATLESLSCGTPIVVTMTGGLQEQVTDGENWFGQGIQPSSKAIIGSQQVPWIYEDRICKEDFLEAMRELYNAGTEGRKKLGQQGRAHVLKNYNFNSFKENWVNLMLKTHEDFGSWENRKEYTNWRLAAI
tara:strand:+ start:14911 stop:16170 length:1260 start_codon:yes stop_codon:yes gene_type:complete